MPFALVSPAFHDRSPLPAKFTCDGADVSPPLGVLDPPPKALSLALICDDPDAPGGTFVHWVLYNLPPDTRSIPEGVPAFEILADLGRARQGKSDFGRVGYGGPCPPPGAPHHYQFKLYALDVLLPLKGGPSKADVERAMDGHMLATSRLVGVYERGQR
ncbi:MAG TPA: YbhB/YbcL family Raf kinase inhibitor-like protein [Gemmatimonadales bacterium]|nr:YbhB/YbcL family Raf kinase inhibitor-like protein [Gemmatimonadales bacterium]